MDQYLSLADAWAQFWAKEAPPILQNRLLARPPAPNKKFLKDPKTEKSYESPQQGQEFAEGNTPYQVVELLISKFREVVVYPLESSTFVKSSSGKISEIELGEWWPKIKGLLAEKHTVILGDWAKDINEKVNIYDGGPLSWSAYRVGTEFPIDVCFDRYEFEKIIYKVGQINPEQWAKVTIKHAIEQKEGDSLTIKEIDELAKNAPNNTPRITRALMREAAEIIQGKQKQGRRQKQK